jgi:hypothetical protein
MTNTTTIATQNIIAVRDHLTNALARALAFDWSTLEIANEINRAIDDLDTTLEKLNIRRVVLGDGRAIYLDGDDPHSDAEIVAAIEGAE